MAESSYQAESGTLLSHADPLTVSGFGEPGSAAPADRFSRRHDYLRISVTDRCNLRCRYCSPPNGVAAKPGRELLTTEELVRLAGMFSRAGIRKIRITGGEPLVRKGVEDLCRRLALIPGVQTLCISTNGILLDAKATELRRAGVQRVNISLDTLRPDRFRLMTLRHAFDDVMKGIDSARKAGFPSIKINVVVMRGFNDDEIVDFVGFAQDRSLNVRFIEYMPFAANGWKESLFISCGEIKKRIEEQFELLSLPCNGTPAGPAKEFRVSGGAAVVGFIGTLSKPFCGRCNRLRISADGRLSTCLFSGPGLDLKKLIRSNRSEDEIMRSVRNAVRMKWESHPSVDCLAADSTTAMTAVGG